MSNEGKNLGTTYTIVTCDWNPTQTKMWLHYVEKNCPNAQILLIPDIKPVPFCWSSGKLGCFFQDTMDRMHHRNKLIYLDTDTIVLRDLYPLFEKMGDCFIGSGLSIVPDSLIKAMKKNHPGYLHLSSGMLLFNDMRLSILSREWMRLMFSEKIIKEYKWHSLYEEYCLSLAVENIGLKKYVWDIPLSIHGNILSGCKFGGESKPWVIHYHNLARLWKFGLGHYQIGGRQNVSRRSPVKR